VIANGVELEMRPGLSFYLVSALSTATGLFASDWPQLLGPTRNGVYPAKDLVLTWSKDGPPTLWKKDIGHGFSGPIVFEHKLVLFHRLAALETVECLDSSTGKSIWTNSYPTAYVDDFGFDDGPRATPTFAEGRVYTFGAEGMLQCLEASSGKRIWNVDTKTGFQAPKGFFGMACSPLVEGNAVLMNIGGTNGAGIVAFDKTLGKVLWKTSNDPASYSSPAVATLGSQRCVLFLTASGLVAADPVTGTVRFQYPWRSRNFASVNSATPLILGDSIFLSASYGTGAVLLQVKDAGLEKIWSSNDVLSNHYATSVEHGGFLYGIHGRTDPGFRPGPDLRCVELKTGKIQWREQSVGAASITLAGDHLLILTEKGELICAAANPDKFQSEAQAQILSPEVRAFPAVADGCFYARNKSQLICVKLR
jgi:outer membrane protein assembly factor BamB